MDLVSANLPAEARVRLDHLFEDSVNEIERLMNTPVWLAVLRQHVDGLLNDSVNTDLEALESDPSLSRPLLCTVCLEEYVEGVVIVLLPCHPSHHFHRDCIHRWLQALVPEPFTCPICRAVIVERMQPRAARRLPEFYNRFAGRSDLLKYAAKKGIPVVQTAAKPWSTDENLHHISYEAGILEEPDVTPPKDMWKLMKDLQEASADGPQCIDLTFTRGVTSELVVYKPSTEQREVVGKATDVLDIFLQLNSLARAHGIGRIDIVEN
ncbi:hypothetical protein PtB15_6B509 [Puccinia triticina]|nr:hypothetical protein PtB15_6B509 [Puccinia triticina]